jgi:hypothetical protein
MSQDLPKGRDPSSPAPKTPQGNSSKKKYFKAIGEGGLSDDLAKTALELYKAGYNVVLVDPDKKPLSRWSPRERISLEELERLLGRATGVAIIGGRAGYWGDVAYVMLIDIDDPSILDRAPKLRELVESTVSWRTGPRCSSCYNKHITVTEYGKRFKCSGEHGGKRVGCGLEFTVEEAARGLGAVVLADIDAVDKLLKGGSVRLGPVELLINNYQLIPPSLHPTGVRYEWIREPDLSLPNHGLASVGEEFLKKLLEELRRISRGSEAKAEREANAKAGAQRGAPPNKLRELSDSDILEIKEALVEAYKPGVRQFIWLFLSGWAAKAGISPVSVAKILKMLYESCNDTDSLKTRASAIVYSYKKAGINLESYARQLEELLGVRPYGLESEVKEEEVKGVSGLQEVLESVVGEERALEIVRLIADKLGVASPYRDSIVEILDYEKRLFAVADLRNLAVVRARGENNGLRYKERVIIGAPTEVVVYVNPVGGITKYQVKWETATRPKPLIIGPASIDEILGRLRAEGSVVNSRLAGDILNAVIEGFIRRKKAVIKHEFEAPGFYWVKDEEGERIVAVNYEVEEPKLGELREALVFLDVLTREWFGRVQDRFVTVIKWWILAPFNYAIKQMSNSNSYIQALYQYGPPNTRKSTINMIGTSLWGFRYPEVTNRDGEVPGHALDSPPRMEFWLSRGTFPVSVKEPRPVFEDANMVEMLKSAIEGLIARGKYKAGGYVLSPALAPLSFTSNSYVPRDVALVGKRLYVITYFASEALNPEKEGDRVLMKRFESEVLPRLSVLKAVGQYVVSRVIENPGLLRGVSWVNNTWLELAEKLLGEAFVKAGLGEPEWLKLRSTTESITEVHEDLRETIRMFMLEEVNDAWSKHVGRVTVERPTSTGSEYDTLRRYEVELENRLRILLDNQWIPWMFKRVEDGVEVVYITTGVLDKLRERRRLHSIDDLRSLAELLGFEYKPRHPIRLRDAVTSRSVIRVSLQTLVKFLLLEEPSET